MVTEKSSIQFPVKWKVPEKARKPRIITNKKPTCHCRQRVPILNSPLSDFRAKFPPDFQLRIRMDRFLRMNAAGMGMGQGAAAPTDAPVVDTAEQVYISSLALLKMLKHGRAGKRCLKLEGSFFFYTPEAERKAFILQLERAQIFWNRDCDCPKLTYYFEKLILWNFHVSRLFGGFCVVGPSVSG